jgi:hypothetical protein
VLAIDAGGNSRAERAAVWQITTDFFAANCNKLVERSASRTDEPDGEVVDAFTSDPGIRSNANHDAVAFFANSIRVSTIGLEFRV